MGATGVSYMIFGRLVLFIAGTLVGAIVHSSWETHRRRNGQQSAIFAWKAAKEKGVEDDLETLKVSNPTNFDMYAKLMK